MTKDDIIKMAVEAGLHIYPEFEKAFERFAALVAAAEREACAGLRKEIVLIGGLPTEYEEGFWDALRKYEDAIRARSQL